MKHVIYILGIAMLMVMAACSDFHASDNGKLDGFWQLTQADTLANGRSEDMRPKQIFWSVQANLLKMEDLHAMLNTYPGIFFHFEMKDGKLRVYDPVLDNREESDSIITSVETLRFYGLGSLDETFAVLQLEETKMMLENERLRLYFRKY